MNRLGDCICAIPAKPPQEHYRHCPVKLRSQVEDALARLEPDERERFLMELLGAGAVQAPGRAPDAWLGAPRRAAAPVLRLVKPSPPNQPLAFTGRFHVADGRGDRCASCGLVLVALEGLPEPLQQNCPGGPRRGGP